MINTEEHLLSLWHPWVWPCLPVARPLIPCFLCSGLSGNNCIFYISHIHFTFTLCILFISYFSAWPSFILIPVMILPSRSTHGLLSSTLHLTLAGFAALTSPKLVPRILVRFSPSSQEPFAFWSEISCRTNFSSKPLWKKWKRDGMGTYGSQPTWGSLLK